MDLAEVYVMVVRVRLEMMTQVKIEHPSFHTAPITANVVFRADSNVHVRRSTKEMSREDVYFIARKKYQTQIEELFSLGELLEIELKDENDNVLDIELSEEDDNLIVSLANEVPIKDYKLGDEISMDFISEYKEFGFCDDYILASNFDREAQPQEEEEDEVGALDIIDDYEPMMGI